MKFFSKKILQKWSISTGLSRRESDRGEAQQINSLELANSLQKISQNRSGPEIGHEAKNSTSLLHSAAYPQTAFGDSANFIQIGLASSDEIQNWSERSCFIGQGSSARCYEIGEVKRPDTLNYRTFKPEKDGLFCERIFGPVNDWTCSCGQIKEQRFAIDHERVLLGKFKPKICNVCQVEVTSSRLRRYRMGYISLACPVTHIWYLNSRPSLFSILLKIPTKYVKKIAYYKAYSPSTLSIEYMSACLGPGGDFFDNEWEFLHFWLSGKHSLEDKPSPITKKMQIAQAEQKKKKLQKRLLKSKTPSGFDEMTVPENLFLVSKNQFSRSQIGKGWDDVEAEDLNLNKQKDRKSEQTQVSNFPPGKNFKDTGEFTVSRSDSELGSSNVLLVGRLDEKSFFKEKVKNSNQNDLKELENIRSISGAEEIGLFRYDFFSTLSDFRKMPEAPEWLLNTGAQALSNHLESRDWEKEIEKLEFELQSTPSVRGFEIQLGEKYPDFTDKSDEMPFQMPFHGSETSSKDEEDSEVLNTFQRMEETWGENFETQGAGEVFEEKDSKLDFISQRESDFLVKRRKNRIRTLKLLKSFQKSGFSFTGMIFTNLPVLPPELRPIIQLGAGQLASSDVNDLYRRILSRNNRLKYYLYETHFVEFLVRSEQQLVQLAVDALLENGKTTAVRHTSGQKRLYKSLSDRIGGKQGRFRMNLLGKRVDYSGRSVIVVGPKLKLSQCGLPYEMALELFQPFLLRHMLELQLAKTIRAAKNILRFNKPLARQLLHHVIQAHPILLNRAPTLHRLGIQAFQPVLVYGRALHLHPLVCPAFNADFDGDQMAVHIPLSPQARIEARLLMLASGNWLSSSTGQPNVLPSQDMVLGFYYLTLEKYGYQKGRGLVFQNLYDVLQAYQLGSLDLHSQIWVKWFGPFTSELNSKLTSPQKHDKNKSQDFRLVHSNTIRANTDRGTWFSTSAENFETTEKPFNEDKHFQNLVSRFRREQDQPIEIRLNQNGISTKIYSSYQWQEDAEQKQFNCYIRTTPGRVLMNQLFHKFA